VAVLTEAPERDIAKEGRHGPQQVEESDRGQVFYLDEGGIVGGNKEKEESKRRDPLKNPRSDLMKERAGRKRASVLDSGGVEVGLSIRGDKGAAL